MNGMGFLFCKTCGRFCWFTLTNKGGVCNECGREILLCKECGKELSPPEHNYCGLCMSAGEHIGDLSWVSAE